MNYFSANTYQERRLQLSKKIEKGVLLFPAAKEQAINYTDNTFPFRQDSNFLYYFGINLPGLVGLIEVESQKTMLFGDEYTIDDIIWIGQQKTLATQAEEVGISEVKPLKDLSKYLNGQVHFCKPYHYDIAHYLGQLLGQKMDHIFENWSISLTKAVIDQRSVKTEDELKLMHEAVNISGQMHLAAMQITKPGKMEYETWSAIIAAANSRHASLSYQAIVSVSGQVLHNHHHHQQMKDGQLLLIDAGAEHHSGYAGDITRTIPVNGQFSTKQKEIYEIVLAMEQTAIDQLKPGKTYQSSHLEANKLMLQSLVALGLIKGDIEEMFAAGVGGLFMPHGLGHMIGLDVHDMENLDENLVGYSADIKRSTQLGLKSLRLAKALEKGYALTVEPGIYFVPDLIEKYKAEKKFLDFVNYEKLTSYYDFGGIRIEDNVYISDTAAVLLGDPIPKTMEDVQKAMK